MYNQVNTHTCTIFKIYYRFKLCVHKDYMYCENIGNSVALIIGAITHSYLPNVISINSILFPVALTYWRFRVLPCIASVVSRRKQCAPRSPPHLNACARASPLSVCQYEIHGTTSAAFAISPRSCCIRGSCSNAAARVYTCWGGYMSAATICSSRDPRKKSFKRRKEIGG